MEHTRITAHHANTYIWPGGGLNHVQVDIDDFGITISTIVGIERRQVSFDNAEAIALLNILKTIYHEQE